MAVGMIAGSAPRQPRSRHALYLIGEPAYPADSARVQTGNRRSPKGGSATLAALGPFDTLDQCPPGANVAAGYLLINDL